MTRGVVGISHWWEGRTIKKAEGLQPIEQRAIWPQRSQRDGGQQAIVAPPEYPNLDSDRRNYQEFVPNRGHIEINAEINIEHILRVLTHRVRYGI